MTLPQYNLPTQHIMSASLPITNSSRRCTLDPQYVKWFQDKTLISDDEGVYYISEDRKRKYYVHDQVIVLATKDGLKEPPADKKFLRNFIKTRCDPKVQAYFNAK
jgi:hypothetical protein